TPLILRHPSLPTAPSSSAFYSLSLHDALPIYLRPVPGLRPVRPVHPRALHAPRLRLRPDRRHPELRGRRHLRHADLRVVHLYLRSEEHTSELQSRENLVCRLLLEKKKKKKYNI